MTTCFRLVHARATRIVAAVFTIAIVGSPASAQQSDSPRPLLNLSGVNAAAVSTAVEAQAASQEDAATKQDSATMDFFRKTEVSGFVDMYYTYNFNTPQEACTTVAGVAVFNCLTNFNFLHNSFSVNLAELALEKKPTVESRGGFRVDFDYGPTTTWAHGVDPGGTTTFQNIQQAYVSYLAPAGTGLQFDFGKFVTWNGAEVIETKDNWNYSRGLLFAWAIPYYHTGMRAAYAINDKVSVMGFLVNGWNNSADNNTGKTVGAQFMVKPNPSLMLMTNYTAGPEQTGNNSDWRHLSDSIVTYTVNSKVSLTGNYDYAQDKVAGATVKWQGVAAYLKYQANDWFALIPRVEYFDDRDGFSTGAAQKVKEATVTAEFKKDGLITRIEYRGDFSNVPYFLKNTAENVKNQNVVTIGFVYTFTTKAQ